jgi:hypothetical protein
LSKNNSRYHFRDLSNNPPASKREVLSAYRELDNAVKNPRRHVYADELLTPEDVARLQRQGLEKLRAVQEQMRNWGGKNQRPSGSGGKGLA